MGLFLPTNLPRNYGIREKDKFLDVLHNNQLEMYAASVLPYQW